MNTSSTISADTDPGPSTASTWQVVGLLAITVFAYYQGAQVDSYAVTLSGDSETVSFPGPVDLLEWDNISFFGIDNVQYDAASCPP